jgi:Holliday junction resolvasome RuvABC endonuclease subunit
VHYIIGVDISTWSIAHAHAFVATDDLRCASYEEISRVRFADARFAEIITAFRHALLRAGSIDYAFVEDIPFIRGQNGLRLAQVLGGVRAVFNDLGIPCQLVNNASWKKRVVGSGRATKDDIRTWVHRAFPFILNKALGDLSQNECDAIGVAVYGVSQTCQEAAPVAGGD